jgi:hypothetical protein
MKKASWMWSCCAAVLVSACSDPEPGPGGNPDNGGGNTPTPITVTGKAVEGNGKVSTTVSILIPGNGRQATTVDSSGTFSFSGVTTPYDIIVVDRERRTANVYKGLTRSNLTLPIVSEDSEDDHEATVEGTVTGGKTPYEEPTPPPKVAFFSANASGSNLATDSSGGYSLGVGWSGSSSITGRLYAIQSDSSAPYERPSNYFGFGRRDNVTLGAGATLSGQDIAMSSVTNSRLAGNVTVPSGYTLDTLSVNLVPEPNAELTLFYDSESTGAFDYVVPQIPQATFSMQVMMSADDETERFNTASSILFKKGLTAGTTNVALVLQPAPRPGQPSDKATDVTRTTGFSWSAYSGGIYQVTLEQQTDESPYKVHLFTSETQTTIPDLSALGLNLPASTSFRWQVQGIAPLASVDALIGLAEQGNPLVGSTDISLGLSEWRSFTTASTP